MVAKMKDSCMSYGVTYEKMQQYMTNDQSLLAGVISVLAGVFYYFPCRLKGIYTYVYNSGCDCDVAGIFYIFI